MKLVKNTLLLTALFSMSFSAHALKGDTDQPMEITSGTQSLDMENSTVVLTDNVVITQGSIKINAAKVTIVRQEGKRETVDAQGGPVTFQQTLDNGKPVNGKANSVSYDLNSEFLTLVGNAELKQIDSFIKAERITYDVKKQQLKATSGGKSRVKTVLIPMQLKQNDVKSAAKKSTKKK